MYLEVFRDSLHEEPIKVRPVHIYLMENAVPYRISTPRKVGDWNLSELEIIRIGICQNWNLSELEFIRIGICQNWNLSELEFVRIGICQNWNLSDLEFVRIGICQNRKLSE